MTTLASTGVAAVTVLPDAPVVRDQAQAVAIGQKIYLIGGVEAYPSPPYRTPVLQVDVFDPATSAWSTESNPIPAERRSASAIAWGNKILLFGGYEGNQALDSVLEYDTVSGIWSARGAMPNARADHRLISHGGRFFILGGSANSGSNQSSYEYFPLTDSWAVRAPMLTPMSQFAVLSIGTKLACLTGTTMDEYDVTSNTWTSRPSGMPGGWIFACSGSDERKWLITLNSLYIFQPLALIANATATAPMDGGQPAFVFLDDKVYRFGGRDAFGYSTRRGACFDLSATQLMYLFKKL